ncbi:MAG TPA: 2-amino-4-hydroxy-6-hydroxymethyldihydropteridine diphosphokinase [Usitatibacter sp.]|nr:2-amino-4-hydroxy-6-hydroxymethyldihydropteridine diphosphokinase [Usitatibacter sp.]
MKAPVRAMIALGSNLDDPQAQVLRGFDDIAALTATRLLARSPLYRTVPVGYLDQPAFVNACALIETALTPRQLLKALLGIEKSHGRVRDRPNGPRTLDLDIVLYGDAKVRAPGLTIPHPRAHERAFVLAPLVDIWPQATIPGKGSAADWLARADLEGVKKIADAAQPAKEKPRARARHA